MIKSKGGKIWHVFCGEIPEWFTNYRDHRIIPDGVHESEYKWAEVIPDTIIHPEVRGLELLEKLVTTEYKKNFK